MMDKLNKILMSSVNPETKVYLIGRELHENNKIPDALWYAILELKDKHHYELQVGWDTDGPHLMNEPENYYSNEWLGL